MTSAKGALGQILAAVQASDFHLSAAAHDLDIQGDDPVLPTNFRLGTAGAAALASVGRTASQLWHLRTGRWQKTAVDVRRGAIAVRTNRYLRLNGAPLESWRDVSGFYRTGDGGWVQLHCNYPHHRDGILDVLQAATSRAAVEAATARWHASDLEDALQANGLPAVRIRTRREWRKHRQFNAIAELPLMEILKIGDAPPEPMPDLSSESAARPLSGVRMLDLSRVIAGPVCGRTLASLGAQVLRISAGHLPFVEALLMDTGHGKRNAEIDLRTTDGREALGSLARQADIFAQAYRPGSLAGRGFSPEHLAALRPGIVHVSLSAWSHAGPWAARRGFDSLVQSASGIAAEQGGLDDGSDNPPRHLPGQALDYVSGYLAAFGAMTALHRRAVEGGSWLVRVSLAQTGHWIDGLGRVANGDARDRPDLSLEQIQDQMTETETDWGRLSHAGPLFELSETPPHWELPASMLGRHRPLWT